MIAGNTIFHEYRHRPLGDIRLLSETGWGFSCHAAERLLPRAVTSRLKE